ncbi:MAG: exosortase/archaeosortase family protein [Candidatus Nitrosocaldus sp.]|nr:exosortase/archaeosortase family protein [Candidatus Nitrosocaldus sp.]MDW8000240.1 exosortase/archaeosortase family protein [Candidatus Nitrosocaldus sp.]
MSLAVTGIKPHTAMLVKAAVIAVAVALIYASDLAIVFRDALVFSSANITNYILVIPFLIAYIVYRKRRMLIAHAIEPRARAFRLDDAIGLTMVFAALMLYIYGSLTLYAMEYHIYSIPILVAGLTALLFNLRVLRHAIFAIAILAYLQPPPAELLSEIAGDLSWISATLAEAMLKAYGLQVALQVDYGAPALVVSKGEGQTPFFVGEPSSGLFSTIGLSLFALIAAYIARGAIWKRVVMYIIGFPIFFMLNALRISIIIWLWYQYGEQVSEAFHAMSGSMMAVPGTLAILIIGERLLGVRISLTGRASSSSRKKDGSSISSSSSSSGSGSGKGCEHCSLSRSLNEHVCLACSNLLEPVRGIDGRAVARFFLIALIVGSMVTVNAVQVQAQSSIASRVASFDMLSIDGRERDTVGIFLPEMDGYRLEYSYRDQRVEKVLRQDAALAYRYVKLNWEPPASADSNNSNLPAELRRLMQPSVYVAVQISTGKHTWEHSMLMYPSRVGRPTAEVLELKDVQIDKDNKARFFAYIRPGQKNAEAVLYWFERVPLKFGDAYENRNIQIVFWSYLSTLAKNGFIKDEGDIKGAEEFYLSMARPVKEYWNAVTQELLAQKTVENTVRQRFPIVMGAALLPASLLSIREFARFSSARSRSRSIYSRLVGSDKAIIDALIRAESKGMQHMLGHGYATTEEVMAEYARLTGKNVSIQDIMLMLKNARESGLVKSIIVGVDDEPRLAWKSNVK